MMMMMMMMMMMIMDRIGLRRSPLMNSRFMAIQRKLNRVADRQIKTQLRLLAREIFLLKYRHFLLQLQILCPTTVGV